MIMGNLPCGMRQAFFLVQKCPRKSNRAILNFLEDSCGCCNLGFVHASNYDDGVIERAYGSDAGTLYADRRNDPLGLDNLNFLSIASQRLV